MANKDTAIVISKVEKETVQLHIVGTSPIILNRMSEKARRELLLPGGRKTTADKQSSAKHDPIAEFQASPYRLADESAPTLLGMMASAFKGAMCTAALDMPGAKKAQIGRLVYVLGDLVPLYGIPQLLMAVTRSADMNRTPDIRTRAIVPQWVAVINVSFVSPIMKPEAVINLLAAGGITAGVGDWRPEKGKGDYGQFRIANADDPDLLRIIATGERQAQIEAMSEPVSYDLESAEMLSWYNVEASRRGFTRRT